MSTDERRLAFGGEEDAVDAFPAWVKSGADVVVVTVGSTGENRTLHKTSIQRLTKTRVVLADARFPRFALRHFEQPRSPDGSSFALIPDYDSTDGGYTFLYSAADPAAAAQERRIEVERVTAVFNEFRRRPDAQTAAALARAADAFITRTEATGTTTAHPTSRSASDRPDRRADGGPQ